MPKARSEIIVLSDQDQVVSLGKGDDLAVWSLPGQDVRDMTRLMPLLLTPHAQPRRQLRIDEEVHQAA